MTTSYQLLPCPCCGGKPMEMQYDGTLWVQCEDCALNTAACDASTDYVQLWNRRATQPAAGEPIQVEAVAVTRARKNGGLALEWLIEGGISALEAPGVVLLVAHGTVIDDQGSGEVYLAPPAAAHGDEAVLWELLEELRTATDRQALPGAFIRVMWEAGCDWINARAAMRAQGDGEVQ